MWAALAKLILRNRILLSALLIATTVFMGYRAAKIELSYEMARVLPTNDPAYQNYMHFKSLFGEDGSVMVIGLQDDDIFNPDKFNGWYDLGNAIKKTPG